MRFCNVQLIPILLVVCLGWPSPCCAQLGDETKPKSGKHPSHKHTNALAGETSPYLLQHAHNPVDWHPWGPEAFAKAKAQNKPIFLSIGYSTCYWCHVMERESFEREDVAEIINEHFIAIKVDREERPEVDQQYMIATQLLTGRGGWPNSVFLTPEGQPWMAGTYFPRKQFKQVLKQLSDVWKNRHDEVLKQAAMLTKAIEQSGDAPQSNQPISQELIDQAIAVAMERFDDQYGGFGTAPKFPPHATLALLIDQYRRRPNPKMLNVIDTTLTQMARGGIYDQLGGGFHRYSTDAMWLLPHFEKMLYDNGQLMRAYTDGYRLTGDESHRDTVEGIFQWLQREMTSPDGGFYSAVDSESDAEEGKFYVWTYAEILKVLGDADGKLFASVYGVEPAGNFKEEASGTPSKNNVLHRSVALEQIASEQKIDVKKLSARLEKMRSKLLAVRQKRDYPHLDDKILAAWNGLMIEGLAYAGRNLDEPRYIETAERAAKFILDKMIVDGRLQRTHRGGISKLDGYLNDYAFIAAGLIELYRATEKQRYLDAAKGLADTALAEFQDEQSGGFYFTQNSTDDDATEFVIRSKNLSGGGNLPNGNGVMAMVLFDLAELTEQPSYAAAARRTLAGLSGFLWQSAGQADHLLIAAATSLARDSERHVTDPTNPDAVFKAKAVQGKVYSSRVKVVAGQSFQVAVKLMIDDGWHLYAANSNVDFVHPTTLTFADNNLAEVLETKAPKGVAKRDPVIGREINLYEDDVMFVTTLRIPKDAKPGKTALKLTITSQACDSQQCAQPSKNTIELELVILPSTEDNVPVRHRDIFGEQ